MASARGGERIAIERDAVLRQLASESDAMRQRGVAEGQLMDPKLRVGAVNVPVDSFSLDAEDMTMLEVGVSQEFPAGRNARTGAQAHGPVRVGRGKPWRPTDA